jgi:MYXO-CTERM domain-containing protein
VLKGSDGDPPYAQFWQTALAGDGKHEIRAVAYDLYESSAEATIQVTVDAEAGNGGDSLVDPIPCGCAARRGGPAGALLIAALVALALRRRP